jgi:glycosyltransferase involved in cell wall biosynthesis
MTRVGWLADEAGYRGGAELTQAEFRAAAPDDVEIVDCPPGGIAVDCDRYVIHNCVLYTEQDFDVIGDRPAIKYHHDVGPHVHPEIKARLAEYTTVCCSPIQAEYMGLADALYIPPAVDLARFEQAGLSVNGNRAGAVCVGSWRNFGKAPHKAAEWAHGNGGIDFFGSGPFAPPGSQEVAYEGMPGLLARYTTFVYLPTVIEPFGRLVAEAWASGCEIVTNRLVGARYWIEENPSAIETAGDDFWRVVLR